MRYVPSIPPATRSPDTRGVQGLYAVYAVNPVRRRTQGEPYAGPQPKLQQAQGAPAEERRKANRRTNQQKMLVELRSDGDRRDAHEVNAPGHIDEIA